MRAEVKVGLIVGLVAIAGGAVWWFSRSTNELQELPLDRRALETKSTDDTILAGDKVPIASGVRPGPAPARRKPDVTPPVQAEKPAPKEPAGTTPSAEKPREQAPAPGERRPPPAEKPFAGEPSEVKADDTAAAKVDEKPGGAVEPKEPPSVVERPRRRLTPGQPPLPPRRTYVIQPGDRLIDLARQEYDDWRLWEAIKAVNPGVDEKRLQVGATIEIPSREEALRLMESAGVAEAARAAPPGRRPGSQPGEAGRATYVVERGDSLIKIARNVLHDETRWQEIYELNRDQLESPHLLRIGMELRLPPLEKVEVPAAKADDG